MITQNFLQRVCRTVENERATVLVDLFNELLPKYQVTDQPVICEFIAQCAVEGQEFSHKSENLNYSAEGLMETFPKYFTAQTAALCAHNPVKIANMVYCYRMGNGSYVSGDGYTFRGAGFIGGTGRDIFARYGKYIGNYDPVAVANECRTDDRAALDIALWIFCIEKDLMAIAEREDTVAISKRINGGTNGLQARIAYMASAKKYYKS